MKDIERHNSRRKCSKGYDGVLNYDLFGKATRIVEDTENFINEKFQPFIDEYNEKQSRNDRKINISPFDFFEKKSQTQIAVETIFQIGRKELWDSMRELCLNDEIFFQGFKSQINDIYLETQLRKSFWRDNKTNPTCLRFSKRWDQLYMLFFISSNS